MPDGGKTGFVYVLIADGKEIEPELEDGEADDVVVFGAGVSTIAGALLPLLTD